MNTISTVCGHADWVLLPLLYGACRGSEGGGLYAASSHGHNFRLSLRDTHITANEAHTGGGMFLRGGETHIGPGSTISRNRATQQAAGVGWVGSCSMEVCQSVLDVSCKAQVTGNTAAVAGGGLFVGQTFGTHLTVSAECAAQAVRNNSAAFGEANIFYVRGVCRPGEVSRGGWCERCLPPTFSFDASASQCHVCPAHAQCLGGAVLLPEPGFWHSTNNSTQIWPCPNPAACNHTLSAANAVAPIDWQCAPGYRGRVCGKCASPDFGLRSPYKCGQCMSFGKTLGLYAASLCCLVAFLCYSSVTTFKDNQQQRTAPRVSDTIKTLMLYLNYVVIFSSLRIDWPKSLSVLYVATSWLLSSSTGEALSLDCLLPTGGPLPLALQRTLVNLFVPFLVTAAVVLVFVASWALGPVLCRRRRPTAFCARVAVKLPTALLVCLYLFFPGLLRVAWGMFACLKLDEPGKQPYAAYAIATAPFGYWVQDLDQACYTGWHLAWSLGLGLVSVLLFCVGVPLAILLWLVSNRSRLSKPEFHMHYAFLYADFTGSTYYYEAVAAARTVLLVCVAVFASVVGPYYAVVMFVVIFHTALVLQLSLRPFAFAQLHNTQLAALGCLDLTGCVTLTFFAVGFDTVSHSVGVYKEIAGAILLAVHATFICWCLWVMVSGLPVQRIAACAASVWAAVCARASKARRCCIRTATCCCSAPESAECELPAPLAGSASAGISSQKLPAGAAVGGTAAGKGSNP